MKRLICTSLVSILAISGALTAQVKIQQIYTSLKGFSIRFEDNKLVHIQYADTTITEKAVTEYDGITRLKFINDSLAQVQSKSGSRSDIQVKNILSATFRREDGSYVGTGALVGIVGGALIGGLIGAASEDENSGGIIDFRGLATAVGVLGGILAGGVTGLIVGGNIKAESTEVIDFSHSSDKKAQLEALLIRNKGR